jgi:hypothetical protein
MHGIIVNIIEPSVAFAIRQTHPFYRTYPNWQGLYNKVGKSNSHHPHTEAPRSSTQRISSHILLTREIGYRE